MKILRTVKKKESCTNGMSSPNQSFTPIPEAIKKKLRWKGSIPSYKELEFVCYNSDFPESTSKLNQRNLYSDLKKLQKDSNNGIFPYMQDFCDSNHDEFSLAVIILDKNKYSELKRKILSLSKKHNIELDMISNIDELIVDETLKGIRENLVNP